MKNSNSTVLTLPPPLLSDDERKRLLIDGNATAADYPGECCIHQLFEAQVDNTPDNIALAFEDRKLSYRQLNARAHQLAHYLQSLGVGPEVLVGICIERSLEMIVGVLGILKAGGAYVPLDSHYPKERLAFMLEDANTPVLLTQKQLLAHLPAHQRAVCLDDDTIFSRHSKANPASGAQSHHLAYVIYTSGSTGRPKGVLVSHSNLHRLFSAT